MIGDRLNLSARWRENAACRGRPTSWWFALPRTPEAELAASICAECPVAVPCTAHAREHKELGRWGEHARLVDKYRSTRVTPDRSAPRGRDGLWRCFECGMEPLPFLSEHALMVHRAFARHHLEGRVAEFEGDIEQLEREAAG